MLKKAIRQILLFSNAIGAVLGVCVLVLFLVLATIRHSLALPFSIIAVDKLLQGLLVGGAILLAISILGLGFLVKEDWKAGKWLLVPYITALLVITGLQIYIMTILLMSQSAPDNDVITTTKPEVQQTYKEITDVGSSGWNTVPQSVLPGSNVINIYNISKENNKERLKRQLSYFNKAYDRINQIINIKPINKSTVPDIEAETEASSINKQTEKLKKFFNLQMIKNKSLETVQGLGSTAYNTGKKLGGLVSKPIMKVGKLITRNFFPDNKYVDLLKPILGNFSKLVLLASKVPAVLASEIIIILVQMLYISMAIFYCVIKFKTK